MRRPVVVMLACVAIAGAAQTAGASVSAPLSASQVVTRFAASTDARLRVDKAASYPGHYTALVLLPSVTNTARFGRFNVWVVGSGSDEDVKDLLADGHTGVLGSPGPSSIYWERGRSISGTSFWLAKKRYGSNIVVWWYGTRQAIDPSFKRLHKALTSVAAGA